MTSPQEHPALEPDFSALLARHEGRPDRLLQVLREIQEVHQFITPRAVTQVARALGVPLARVWGVIDFYSFLTDKPWGRDRVLFSDNITDRMLGNMDLLLALCGIARAVTGRDLQVHYRPARGTDVKAVVLDSTRFAGRYGWKPAISLEEGMARMWHWLSEQP